MNYGSKKKIPRETINYFKLHENGNTMSDFVKYIKSIQGNSGHKVFLLGDKKRFQHFYLN